ncbi:hypothetical protein ILUMI_01023 [Ignelater luminosus]|uniref:Uncharacterized protein n=1 Tax=Ignelater luminosus TaxID=2038154 RepID=A0A8K0DL32_IGNLU|nr:hypothetical protein ILUMI_01023 [Ignelater luminosus]
MGATSEERFISSFHSINGMTIGERKKNLFLLLNATRKSLEVTKEEINFSSLHPKSPLEENFKVDALIYFKRVPELMEVLKSGNPVLIEKLLNTDAWFIDEGFKTVSGKELANEIFPHLSYNTKLKLLHKFELYLKDIKKADEYFEAVRENYGVYIGSKMLMACSEDLIMKVITVNRIEITPGQLQISVERYPNLTETLFECLDQYYHKIDIGTKYKTIFNYLAQHNVKLFLKLKEKYNPDIDLGSRSTRKFITKEKENIIKNPKEYSRFLKRSQLLKDIKEDFDEFYLNYLPKSLNALGNTYWQEYLNLPKRSDEEKLNYFLKTFKQLYGSELWEHSDFVLPQLFEMMSTDSREIWMNKNKRPENISEYEWISFMKTDKSIPLLKERISYTSKIKERVVLVCFLIKTCRINHDNEALLEVLKYLTAKHRNDHVTIREKIMKELLNFDLVKLSEEHWKYINEFITLSRLNNDCTYECINIFEKYIYYCLEKELPINDLLLQWTQLASSQYNIITEKPEYEKRCLLMFNETFPSAYNEKDLNSRYVDYLTCLHNWNRRYPKDTISLFINPQALQSIKLNLKSNSYSYTEEQIAVGCLKSDFKKAEEENLVGLLFERTQYHFSNVTNWLIKNHPETFMNHIEEITGTLIKMDSFNFHFSKLFRYYSHLDTTNHFSKHCLDFITDENADTRKAAACILSLTMAPNNFLDMVSSNYPLNLSADIESPEGQKAYKTQQALLPNLRNITPPSLTLDAISKFCKGDYLSLIQRSLYSAALNVPENKLVDFFEALSERAVSVRKHSIFLAFKVLNKNSIFKMLTNFMEKETNHSTHKSLFKGIFNFFLRNPDNYSWELTKLSVAKIDLKDKEAFNILTKYKRIPPTYFADYVLFTFDKLENFQDPNEIIEEGKCRILEAVNSKNISKLPHEFCESVIQKYFLQTEKLNDFQLKVHHFVSKFILYYETSDEKNCKKCMVSIFARLKKYIDCSWYSLEHGLECRKICSNFIKEFCSDFLGKECDNKEILIMFMNLWNDILKPHQAFNDYLYMHFTSLYVEFIKDQSSMKVIGQKIAVLCDSLHNEESLVVHVFYKCFKLFKDKFINSNNEENLFDLIEGIAKVSSTRSSLMLIIYLLPNDKITMPMIKCRYNNIMDLLRKENDNLLQIYLHNYYLSK